MSDYYLAKRNDLVWVHRRLDSIAQYWQPGKVTSITREGEVKVYETVSVVGTRSSEKIAHILRVVGSPMLIVPASKINVDQVIDAWGGIEFTSLQTIEQVQAFVKPYMR